MDFGYIGGLTASWTAMNVRRNKQPVRMNQTQALFLVIWFSFLLGVVVGSGIFILFF